MFLFRGTHHTNAGHAGMEAAIANLIEPGETIVVGNKGIWGQRVCDLAERYGGGVVVVWGCDEARGASLGQV